GSMRRCPGWALVSASLSKPVPAVRRPAAIKRVPIGAKFDIRALNSLETSAITTDWKLDEYDLERPAQGRKSRHCFLGRSRHQRGAAVDEAERRACLRLYRQSRPARRGRLRRDPAQGH